MKTDEINPISSDRATSLGKIAHILGVNRSVLSENLNAKLEGYNEWPSLKKHNGAYYPAPFAIAAALVGMPTAGIEELLEGASRAEMMATLDACAWAAYRVGPRDRRTLNVIALALFSVHTCLADNTDVDGDQVITAEEPTQEHPTVANAEAIP